MTGSQVKCRKFHKSNSSFNEWKLEHTKSGKIKEEYIGKVDVKEENQLSDTGK